MNEKKIDRYIFGECSECGKAVPDDIEICVSCYRKYRRKLAKEALEKIKNE